MRDEFPKGWTTAPLDSLCDKLRGVSYKREEASLVHKAGYMPIVRANNIEADHLTFDELVWVPANRVSVQQKLRTGDVVVAMSSGSKTVVGKTAQVLADWDGGFGAFCGVLRPSTNLNSRYLGLFLRTREYRSQISDLAAGSNINNLKNEHFAAIEVPLAPLAEQCRIVASIETLLERVDACERRMERIPLLIKRFRQSVLAAACSGRLTADWRAENLDIKSVSEQIENLKAGTTKLQVRRGVPENTQASDGVANVELPENWGYYSAAELLRCGAFIDLKDGNHGGNHPKVSEFTDKGLPFITAAQVNNFRIDYDSAYKLSGKPLERIHVGRAKPGDVIYTHKGSVGRVAIADRECILTPQTTYYRVSPEIFSNQYLMFYLASQAFSEQVDIVKEQTTRDFVPISEQYLLFHRVPPLIEQQEIARRVTGLFAVADRVEVRYLEGSKRVDSLTQSILAKAYRGELVPTEAELAEAEDRSFESAEELLERIRRSSRDVTVRRAANPERVSTEQSGKRSSKPRGKKAQLRRFRSKISS